MWSEAGRGRGGLPWLRRDLSSGSQTTAGPRRPRTSRSLNVSVWGAAVVWGLVCGGQCGGLCAGAGLSLDPFPQVLFTLRETGEKEGRGRSFEFQVRGGGEAPAAAALGSRPAPPEPDPKPNRAGSRRAEVSPRAGGRIADGISPASVPRVVPATLVDATLVIEFLLLADTPSLRPLPSHLGAGLLDTRHSLGFYPLLIGSSLGARLYGDDRPQAGVISAFTCTSVAAGRGRGSPDSMPQVCFLEFLTSGTGSLGLRIPSGARDTGLNSDF